MARQTIASRAPAKGGAAHVVIDLPIGKATISETVPKRPLRPRETAPRQMSAIRPQKSAAPKDRAKFNEGIAS